jgi:hypothetical protein
MAVSVNTVKVLGIIWIMSFSNIERIKMEEEMITITKKEYLSLLDDCKWRSALEAGGVDNWECYSESLRGGGYFDGEDEDDQ